MNTFLSPNFQSYNEAVLQTCKITATNEGDQIVLTADDLLSGGFSIDKRGVSGEVIEIGAMIASELSLKLYESPDVDAFPWIGATLTVEIGIDIANTYVYGSVGEFVVDAADKKYAIWHIVALDNMVQFDRAVSEVELANINSMPRTPEFIIREACSVCGVPYGTMSGLVNTTHILPTIENTRDLTWRNLLQWVGELTGTCGYANAIGELCLTWYDMDAAITTANTIDLDRRYRSNLASEPITITGVKVIVEGEEREKVEYISGAEGYLLQIEGNPLFAGTDVSTAVNNLGNKIVNFTYTPFDAETVPYPYLEPYDTIGFVDKNGETHISVVTHCAYALNGACLLKGVGKSAQSKKYSASNPLTKQQMVIIDTVKEQLGQYVNEREKALEGLTQLMANAMGLKFTTINGIFYAYSATNGEDITNSPIVYTFNDKGFAWTKNYNSENPTWEYGITVDGNAYLNQIHATGITVADENSDFSSEITPGAWSLKSKGSSLMSANITTGEAILGLDKVNVGEFMQIGAARLYGTSVGMDIVITEG